MNSMSGQKLKGIPYTGTLPTVLTGTKAGYLHHYKIFGNMTQNGTPTPENPIYPSECGERTANLFDKNGKDTANGYLDNSYLRSSGTIVSSSETEVSEYINVTAGTYYTISRNHEDTVRSSSICFYNASKEYISGVSYDNQTVVTVQAPNDAAYARYSVRKAYETTSMLNEGQTALPFEPYGYKLPLTSGSTPVDIYLGESQTTRRIKKLVLDGTETPASITQTTDGNNYCVAYKYSDLGMTDIKDYDKYTPLCPYPVFVSSHFTMKSIEGLPLPNNYNDIQPGQVGGNTWIPMVASTPTYNRYIIFCVSGITTMNDFKAYLQQQYANGTPVTIWYVLATEETGTLNEPLRKIGNYVDTIDSTQTTAQIPTSANSTTISWGGEGLAPSQFDSIQEWVNTPTYKRVNGEWVADNSN